MSIRTLYSQENGLEVIDEDDVSTLEDATVVVAVLKRGIGHRPTRTEEIDVIWCPYCEWLDADDTHHPTCPHDGRFLI